jgi:hypothetical protein
VFVEGTAMLANLSKSGQKKAGFLFHWELLQIRQRWGDLGQRISSDFHPSTYCHNRWPLQVREERPWWPLTESLLRFVGKPEVIQKRGSGKFLSRSEYGNSGRNVVHSETHPFQKY